MNPENKSIPEGLPKEREKINEKEKKEMSERGKEEILKAIDSLVNVYIEKGWPGGALEAAKLGASTKAIDSLVNVCIEEGWTGGALEAAKLRGKELTVKEIEELTRNIKET